MRPAPQQLNGVKAHKKVRILHKWQFLAVRLIILGRARWTKNKYAREFAKAAPQFLTLFFENCSEQEKNVNV